MKKITLVALLLGSMSLSVFAKGKQPIAFPNLPEMVKASVLKNYSDTLVQYVTWQRALGKDQYDFLMADGTKMQYYENGQLHKIKSPAGVPDALVPEPILNYVRATFPYALITEYKNDPWSQEVELNNDMTLVFNRRGDFLRIV